MAQLSYSVVIATFERPAELRRTLESLAAQTRRPDRAIIIDASRDERAETIAREFGGRLPIRYERAVVASSARQRNQGAADVATPLIAFLDDDVELAPDCFEKLCGVFESDAASETGGVAARIRGMQHAPPRGLLWWYYRLQAGYAHTTYGGRLFGPAVNCLPSYTEAAGDLIPADWLNSTCVLYRTDLFRREQFPEFDGYSFMEDVHLSARIARTHRLYFHATALFDHFDAPSSFKRNHRQLARMRIRNQRLIARDVLGLRGPKLELQLLAHRLFATISVLRRHDAAWWEEIRGTWT